MKKLLKKWYKAYQNSYLKWRYIDNFIPVMSYYQEHLKLNEESKRILKTLNETGIAITTIDKLLGSNDLLSEMQSEVGRIQERQSAEIENQRSVAGTTADEKMFLIQLLGLQPPLDPDGVFVRCASSKEFVGIANAYFKMYTQLRFFNVWQNIANDAAPKRSQLWHRDRDDYYVLKTFLYLNDIDTGNGAMCYAPGTHRKGSIKEDAPSFLEPKRKNPRTKDEDMKNVVPEDQWLEAVGPAGTLVFVDTRGYHKGGLARTGDRLVFNFMYVSQIANIKEFYQRTNKKIATSNREVAFALSH